jgi:hypothetical protein
VRKGFAAYQARAQKCERPVARLHAQKQDAKMKRIFAIVTMSIMVASPCVADERNTTVAAALHENAIEDARVYCKDHLVVDEAREASALAGATATVRKANDPEKLMDRMNTMSAKLRKELGHKEYCAMIARRMPTIYRVR